VVDVLYSCSCKAVEPSVKGVSVPNEPTTDVVKALCRVGSAQFGAVADSSVGRDLADSDVLWLVGNQFFSKAA